MNQTEEGGGIGKLGKNPLILQEKPLSQGIYIYWRGMSYKLDTLLICFFQKCKKILCKILLKWLRYYILSRKNLFFVFLTTGQTFSTRKNIKMKLKYSTVLETLILGKAKYMNGVIFWMIAFVYTFDLIRLIY